MSATFNGAQITSPRNRGCTSRGGELDLLARRLFRKSPQQQGLRSERPHGEVASFLFPKLSVARAAAGRCPIGPRCFWEYVSFWEFQRLSTFAYRVTLIPNVRFAHELSAHSLCAAR